MPVAEIRERRRNFSILYEEVMISADERGISFTAMLLMLAHYKFIDDNKALRYFDQLVGLIFFSLDEFLRRRAKLVRVTDQMNEKICRGLFQTLYWRRAFLAQRSSTSSSSYAGVGNNYCSNDKLIAVPSIVVEESEASILPNPRPALPSLDLTQMRDNTGAGYYPTSSNFDGQDQLHAPSSQHSEAEDDLPSPTRTWSTIGGPESNIATSAAATSELYHSLKVSSTDY